MSDITLKPRKVTILFTQTSTVQTIETNARTWGELQSQITGQISNKRFVVRQTKNTLESAEALLPEGEFHIFGYPKESKAGAKAAKKAKKAAKKVAKAVKKTAKKAVKPAKKVAKKAVSKAAPAKAKAVAEVVESVKQAAPAEVTVNELITEAQFLRKTF